MVSQQAYRTAPRAKTGKDGKNGMNKLGFGFLRLPQTEEKEIDWPLLNEMVDAFLAGGGTYFDTAYTYLDGKSETALRRSLVDRHPRESFRIADKLPSWKVTCPEDRERYFREQCQRCGVDYFDVYLLHWLNRVNYAIAERFDEFGFLRELKQAGKVGKIGFSYHGDAETLKDILSAHPEVEVVQLQINYLDWDSPALEAHKCYDIASRYGKEVVVMEPVKGGTLADPLTWLRLFTHVLGHASWEHYAGNMMLFLLIGPMLEERTRCVVTGIRPEGRCAMMDTSMSPNSDCARVRGIGVALMSRKSTFSPFSSKRRRCCTPKRCCSSATTMPRS